MRCYFSGSLAPHMSSIPGLERSPGEGNGYPLQHSGLENSMDCIVHGSEEQNNLFYIPIFLLFLFFLIPS